MSTGRRKPSQLAIAIAVAAAAGAFATPATAQFTPIDISGVTNSAFLNAGVGHGNLYPFGAQTLGGVPFLIDQTGGVNSEARAWFANTAASGGPGTVSVTIDPNVFGVGTVYTLMNTFWGQPGPSSLASLTFTGSGGASFVDDLIGGVDIRDYNQFVYTNTINGTTSQQVWADDPSCTPSGCPGQTQRLDMQIVTLPPAFAGQTLTSVTLTDNGAPGVQRVFLAGLTVQQATTTATPEPASLVTCATGLVAIGLLRRRRTRTGLTLP